MAMDEMFGRQEENKKKMDGETKTFRATMKPELEPQQTASKQQSTPMSRFSMAQPVDDKIRTDGFVLLWRLQEALSKTTEESLYCLLLDAKNFVEKKVIPPDHPQKKKGFLH